MMVISNEKAIWQWQRFERETAQPNPMNPFFVVDSIVDTSVVDPPAVEGFLSKLLLPKMQPLSMHLLSLLVRQHRGWRWRTLRRWQEGRERTSCVIVSGRYRLEWINNRISNRQDVTSGNLQFLRLTPFTTVCLRKESECQNVKMNNGAWNYVQRQWCLKGVKGGIHLCCFVWEWCFPLNLQDIINNINTREIFSRSLLQAFHPPGGEMAILIPHLTREE